MASEWTNRTGEPASLGARTGSRDDLSSPPDQPTENASHVGEAGDAGAGVCILAEFEDAAFWESWLFPPDLGETLAGGKAPFPGGESASALSYALSLVDAPVRLVRADAASALLSIDADIPSTIAETWSGGLRLTSADISRSRQPEGPEAHDRQPVQRVLGDGT